MVIELKRNSQLLPVSIKSRPYDALKPKALTLVKGWMITNDDDDVDDDVTG